MKYIIFFLSLILAFNTQAQTTKSASSTKKEYKANVEVTSDGNFKAIAPIKSLHGTGSTKTDKTYTDNKGQVYPVYKSAKGKHYVIRISKNGNEYKYYLNLPGEKKE